MCNNYSLKADELANKWEALVIKKGGKFACDEENLGILEIQVDSAPPSSSLSSFGSICRPPAPRCALWALVAALSGV